MAITLENIERVLDDGHPKEYIFGLLPHTMANLESGLSLSQRARVIAQFGHYGQKRISGGIYFEHCEEVASYPGFDEIRKAVSYLHDVIQKTPVTAELLKRLGMPQTEVIDEVVALTPKLFIPYFDHIEEINKRPVARDVKIADNRCNMDADRMPAEYVPSPKILFNWHFQYPLSIAFMTATRNGLIPDTDTIVDFIVSKNCPEKLRTPHMLRGFTSHPIPEVA